MRTFIAAIVIMCCASLAIAEDKKYVSKEGKFTVDFGSGEPMTLKQKAGDLELNITSATKGTGSYMVLYSDLPEGTIKSKKPKEIFDVSEKGLKFKVTGSKDTEFGKDKLPAREITASTADKDPIQLRIIMMLADKRLYQVMVAGPKEVVEGKDADAFFKSFEIVK